MVALRLRVARRGNLTRSALGPEKKLSELGDSARIGIVAPTWPVHVIRRQFESSFPELHDIGRLLIPVKVAV